jgi:UDP-glucuronate 4-epimerase
MQSAFVTGACGFIGFSLTRQLLRQGYEVVGLDNFNSYYDPSLKRSRLRILEESPNFRLCEGGVEDRDLIRGLVSLQQPDIVLHLAAQAGVRHALHAPDDYVQSNVLGTYELLETLRRCPPRHLLLASSSSVYGGNDKLPFRETDSTDRQMSLYASTKRAAEAMSHAYSHLHGIPTTCLRFFTVYGPWGRPDMALFKFVDLIRSGKPIEVYGKTMARDFTYINDLCVAVSAVIDAVPVANSPIDPVDSISPVAPFRTVNICRGHPTRLTDFIGAIEESLGIMAIKEDRPPPPGDMQETSGSPELLQALTGFTPKTSLREGVKNFVNWHLRYYETEIRDCQHQLRPRPPTALSLSGKSRQW